MTEAVLTSEVYGFLEFESISVEWKTLKPCDINLIGASVKGTSSLFSIYLILIVFIPTFRIHDASLISTSSWQMANTTRWVVPSNLIVGKVLCHPRSIKTNSCINRVHILTDEWNKYWVANIKVTGDQDNCDR